MNLKRLWIFQFTLESSSVGQVKELIGPNPKRWKTGGSWGDQLELGTAIDVRTRI